MTIDYQCLSHINQSRKSITPLIQKAWFGRESMYIQYTFSEGQGDGFDIRVKVMAVLGEMTYSSRNIWQISDLKCNLQDVPAPLHFLDTIQLSHSDFCDCSVQGQRMLHLHDGLRSTPLIFMGYLFCLISWGNCSMSQWSMVVNGLIQHFWTLDNVI